MNLEKEKKKLYELIKKYGLKDSKVIKQSQKIDRMLNKLKEVIK